MSWISVDDRLPEEGIKVLTYMNEREFNIDYIVKLETEVIWACILDREQNQVTHWMPLPNPPEVK